MPWLKPIFRFWRITLLRDSEGRLYLKWHRRVLRLGRAGAR